MHDREEVKYTMSQHQAGRGQPDPDPEEPELDICMDDALDTLPSVPPAPSRTSSNRSSFPVAHAAHVSPPTPWFTIFSNGSCTGCNLGLLYGKFIIMGTLIFFGATIGIVIGLIAGCPGLPSTPTPALAQVQQHLSLITTQINWLNQTCAGLFCNCTT